MNGGTDISHGFKISSETQCFYRFKNDGEIIQTDLKMPLMAVYIAQHFLPYNQALSYAKSACNEHELTFENLYNYEI